MYKCSLKFPSSSFACLMSGFFLLISITISLLDILQAYTPFRIVHDFLLNTRNGKFIVFSLIILSPFMIVHFGFDFLVYLSSLGTHLRFSPSAIAYRGQSYAYENVSEIYYSVNRDFVKIVFETGQSIKLRGKIWHDIDEWYSLLLEKTQDRIMHNAETALRQGDDVVFGMLRISHRGLKCKSMLVPWREIENIRTQDFQGNAGRSSQLIISSSKQKNIRIDRYCIANERVAISLIRKILSQQEAPDRTPSPNERWNEERSVRF